MAWRCSDGGYGGNSRHRAGDSECPSRLNKAAAGGEREGAVCGGLLYQGSGSGASIEGTERDLDGAGSDIGYGRDIGAQRAQLLYAGARVDAVQEDGRAGHEQLMPPVVFSYVGYAYGAKFAERNKNIGGKYYG